MNARLVDRSRLSRLRWWYVPLVLVPIPVLIFLSLRVQGGVDVPSIGDGSCSSGSDTASRAVFLVDLRKPLDAAYESLPGRMLETVTKDLGADTELGVYVLSRYAEAPRTFLGRLCKPYDNGELVVEAAKDQRQGARDCDDLPAQIPASLRTEASRFCRQRNVLRRRLDASVAQAADRVTDAYLVEALEETSRDFADLSQPKSLYVFSDMMQHAKWYSHVDLRPGEWDFGEFDSSRGSQGLSAEPLAHLSADVPVKVFYVARAGVTDNPQAQLLHKGFWQAYFDEAEVSFVDLPTMAGFAAETLMDVPTPAELAAYEREQVRYRSELVEKERAELARSRRDFEVERAQLAERRQQLEEQQRQLARQQQEFGTQQREAEEPNVQSGDAAGGEDEASGQDV